jgi:hypothetical protein
MRSMVEGPAESELPLHHPAGDEQVRLAPRAAAMSGGHGGLLIPPHELRSQGGQRSLQGPAEQLKHATMRLVDYFRGYRRTMTSPLPPHAVEQRINESTVSLWNFFREGVTGWARYGSIRLKYRRRFWDYSGKPILAGRIAPHRKGSRLELHYRPMLSTYVLLPFYLLVLLFGFVAMIAFGRLAELYGALFMLFWLGGGLGFPLIMHRVGTADCDAQFGKMIDFIEQHAEARQERVYDMGG